MRKLLGMIFLACALVQADTSITNLPALAPASVGSTDVFPMVNLGLNQTSKLKLSDILSIPSLQAPTFTGALQAASLAAGAANGASVIVGASSTTKGFLPPAMTSTQRNAIASPATGLVVYDTTVHVPYFYDGSNWYAFGARNYSVGGAKTSNSSAITSATYVDFSGAAQPNVSVTPPRTAAYKVHVLANAYTTGGTPTVCLHINNSVGSATLITPQVDSCWTVDTVGIGRMAYVEAYYTLTQGVAYTFTLQGDTSANSLFLNNGALPNGTAMIAEEIG